MLLTYVPMPAIKPPPPMPPKTKSTGSRMSAISSMPTVPCPATTFASSNGWMNAAPSRSPYASASRSESSKVSPISSTSTNLPPNSFTCEIFWRGVVVGMKILPGISSALHEYATPWAWLPALAQTTPLASCSSDKLRMRL